MSVRHEAINVRVSQRILWFGSEAYPLHNITRTNQLRLYPNRVLALKRYVIMVVLSLFVAAIVASALPGALGIVAVIGVLAWIAYKTIRLIEFLRLTLYELVVETAAGSHRGLVSDNGNVVADLSFRITDAINNPHAEFEMRVENFHVGDHINMIGNHNTGKMVG
jgi:hypothetical protein